LEFYYQNVFLNKPDKNNKTLTLKELHIENNSILDVKVRYTGGG